MSQNNSNDVILKTKKLTKYFSVRSGGVLRRRTDTVFAVDKVDLQVESGKTFGLVGESGCGKTTLARLILKLIPPTDGRIIFDGRDITDVDGRDLKALRQHIQLIFQDPYDSLNPRMKVGRAIEEPLRIHEIDHSVDRKARVEELLNVVGLEERFVARYPAELSGGQRQRVGIARALALTPKLIICDEPVSALDVSIRAQIINLLEDLQEEFGLTYIFISHDLSVVEHIADTVAVMYLGRIVETASRRAIFTQPHHPYTEALLSAIPVGDPKRERKRRRIVLEGDPPSPIHRPSGCHFHPRCPIAQEKCSVEEPELREVTPGQFAACHFAAPFPVSRNGESRNRLARSNAAEPRRPKKSTVQTDDE